MGRTGRIVIGIVVLVLIVGGAVFGYIYVSGGSGAPSVTLSAPTLAIQVPTLVPTTAATVEATALNITPTAMLAVVTESANALAATSEATATSATAEATAEASAQASSSPVVLNIDSSQSTVSFILNEVLNGSNNKVTGTTNQVAGQIAINFANPSASQVGEIRIDARTLATDSGMRDRMIRSQVLQSSQDQYEFVSFKPTALTGLPASITMGQTYQFQLTGDLTIRTTTKSVTFDVTVTPKSQTEVSGTATATIQRDDFSLTIPSVPQVASVDEAVTLQIDFVAVPSAAT